MDLVEGSSVVITGAASGIGEGLARECVNRGLRVALADVEKAPLDALVDQLLAVDGDVMAGVVDVADGASVSAFAESVEAEFSCVDVVVANAGVIGPRRPLWEQSPQDWEWVIGVNLLGVSNTWAPFLPNMVKRGTGHLVATSSIAGLAPAMSGNAPYATTKHGIVGMAEVLRMDLAEVAPDIGVTVLFPGPVRTRIRESVRNRPDSLGGPDGVAVFSSDPRFDDESIEPHDVALHLLAALERGDRYVMPNSEYVESTATHLVEVAEALQTSNTGYPTT